MKYHVVIQKDEIVEANSREEAMEIALEDAIPGMFIEEVKESSEDSEFEKYVVCIEKRDRDGNIYNSDPVFESTNRDEAIEKAKEYRKQYGTVTIETWDIENDSLLDTTLEYQY